MVAAPHSAVWPAEIQIGARAIGARRPCYIIAEAGVNHDGDPTVAKRLADAAREIGADAVKFQTFRADELATKAAPKAEYQLRASTSEESQLDMLRRLELREDQFRDIAQHCEKIGITFLSSPFDSESADELARIGVPAFKIPSGEIVNPDLLVRIARHNLPVILSTGMATLPEVERALSVLRENGQQQIAVLHCVSSYPAPPETANLKAMRTMSEAFGCPIGFSDHTDGTAIAFAAVACGATIIEKHITLDRRRVGPDHAASLDVREFADMIAGIRQIESALGDGEKVPAACEAEIASVARRSLIASRKIVAGETIGSDILSVRRPGTGLSAFDRAKVIGRKAGRDIPEGTPITADMLE
jgi:N,N'-diacetyllegionaminate synthase